MKAIEWTGSALGMAGASLLATKLPLSPWGWVLFLLSNACWIYYAWQMRITSLLVMQILFTATSCLGIWRWLL